MNILANFDITYELNNYTNNFKFYNNFKTYRRIYHQNNVGDFEPILNKFNKFKNKINYFLLNYSYLDQWIYKLTYCDKNSTINKLKYIKKGRIHLSSLLEYKKIKYLKGYYEVNLETSLIEDKQFKYLKNIHTINISCCKNITCEKIKYLKGVHTIDLGGTGIIDKDLEYLKGVHTIDLTWCTNITYKGLECLKYSYFIDISSFNNNITHEEIKKFKGVIIKNEQFY